MHIELIKPHTHAGKRHAVGDRIELAEASARWLITQGVAKTTAPVADNKPNRRDATSGTTQGD